MKEKILEILMDSTQLVEKASGGNDPIVIAFKFSEDEDKDEFLNRIADEIASALAKTEC